MNKLLLCKKVWIIGTCVTLAFGAPMEAMAAEMLVAKNVLQTAGAGSLLAGSKTT